jgi:uncharacterized membrane protein YidH (DUF202 family)
MNTSAGTNSTLNSFISAVQTQILTPLVSLLVLAAFVLFIFGVVEYIRNAANEEKRKQGQQHIIWGIVGLVIIFGAGAIITILKNIVGLI